MFNIYLDNNATTPVLPAVQHAMLPYFTETFGNPASSHAAGRRARRALEDARELTAHLLGANPDEVIFTSGATEANNLAIFSLAGTDPAHLLVSSVEHPCVLEPAKQLQQQGFPLDYLPVDATGHVDETAFSKMLTDDTRLICLMLANHETGTIQPVNQCAAHLPVTTHLHCDAAAAAGKMPIHFHDLNVTSLTISGHKFHGPKGIGVLLIQAKPKLRALFHGGHQQQSRRPGTEPVALAVGLAKALELATEEMSDRRAKVERLRHAFLDTLRQHCPSIVNGPKDGGIPHTLNLSFPGCQADILLMNLDLAGIACSTGSACSSGSLLPSPVVQAMGVADDVLHSAMRFSFSHLLEKADVIEAGQRIAQVVRRMCTEGQSDVIDET